MNNLNPTRGNNINIGIIINTLLKLSPLYISLRPTLVATSQGVPNIFRISERTLTLLLPLPLLKLCLVIAMTDYSI